MKKLRFYDYFYIFIIASVFGWILEGVGSIIIDHKLINHSALVIGPFNAIYGIGACFLTAILIKYKDSPVIVNFLISFIGGSLVEYFASLFMELFLGFTAWNYSNFFLNINGRVCLVYSCLWGVLGVVWIKFLYPIMQKMISKINPNFGKKLMTFLLVFLVFDIIITAGAVIRAKNYDKGIPAKNSYEKFLDKTFNKDFLKNMYNDNWE